jgi:hypothetical protein
MKVRVFPKEWLKTATKKLWLRLSYLSAGLALLLLGDEYLKEGYFFDPSEITIIGTHESIITALLAISLASIIIHKIKEVKKDC